MKTCLVAVLSLLCLTAFAAADVTMTSETIMNAMGMSMGGGTIKTYVSGEKMRMESISEIAPAFPMMQQDAPPKATYITRLDKGVNWIVYDIDSSYAVKQISELKQLMAEAANGNQPNVPEQQLDWTISAKTLPDTDINGFLCHGVALHGELHMSGSRQAFDCEAWASNALPGQAELDAFNKGAAEAADIEVFSNLQMLEHLMKALGVDIESLASYSEDLDGIIIKTSLKVFMQVNTDMINPPSAKDSADYEQIKSQQETENAEDDIFAGGREDVDPEMMEALDAFASSTIDGMAEMMSMSMEIKLIETDKVDPVLFEIPEGYKEF
ncbi:MAG: hypothetical protein R3F48_03775 [Candidatus Zixiibacteriota bacterium]